jgi:hypothetical protein
MNWSPANTAVTLMLTLLFLIFLLLFMSMTALPAQGQNSVPPTAVQAAKMPGSPSQHARTSGRPLDGTDIYDNGPPGGQNAWGIFGGYVTTNSFRVLTDNTSITGLSFNAWLFPGDTLSSAEVSISSDPFGHGNRFFDQTENFTQGYCYYDPSCETAFFSGPTLNNGTYWLTLSNAETKNRNPVNWDQNSGDGCQSLGCPSLAMSNSDQIGAIPSESFTILGNATTTTTLQGSDYACPAPQSGFHDLHDFAATAGPSALAIDRGGKLYDTLANGGSQGMGLLYDLVQKSGRWIYTNLYNFLNEGDGFSPNHVIVGPGGALFGSAESYNSCGLIFQARPKPNPCPTSSCPWNETTIYQFSGGFDSCGGYPTTFDSAGNVYGLSALGGSDHGGQLFQLQPSSGKWTENVVYTFDGYSGTEPTSLIVGHDGNLYGTASGGGGVGNSGVVFKVVPTGSGWWLSDIYVFSGTTDGYSPTGLVQDSLGNLYGVSTCWQDSYTNYCGGGTSGNQYGLIFKLSANNWNFSVVYSNNQDCGGTQTTFHGLAIHGLDTLFATEGGSDDTCTNGSCYQNNCGKVIAVPSGANLVTGLADIFPNVTSDANANLYGTTSTCGSSSGTDGMVWKYAP